MADVLRQQKIVDNNKRALIKYVIVFGNSQEANTTILDASSLKYALNTNGYIMTNGTDKKSNYRTTIKRIFGTSEIKNDGGTIKVQWRGDSNSEIIAVGDIPFDYDFQSMGDGVVIWNPEANATGNILISTNSISQGDAMTLFLDLRKDSRDYDAGETADPTAFNKI